MTERPTDDELGRMAWNIYLDSGEICTNLLVPWEDLDPGLRTVFSRIGRALFSRGVATTLKIVHEVTEGMP